MSKITFNKLAMVNNESDITKAINSLHTRGDSLQLDIHKTLVAICVRWNSSGDVRPVAKHINHLLSNKNMGGIRKNAIKLWIETFMGMKLVAEGDNKGDFYVPKELRGGAHLDLKELTNNRWWELKVESEYQPIDDPMKLIKGLMKRLENDRAKAGTESKVTPTMLDSLKAMTTPEVLH